MTVRPSSRDALVEAAFQVLARDSAASLADIAARAGVGRATLHRHFAGRDDLLRTLVLVALEETDAAAEAACRDVTSASEALRAVLEAVVPLGDRHWFLVREPLEDDPAIAAELARQAKETHDLIDAAKQEGALDRSVPTAWIARAYDQLIFAAWESVKAAEATRTQASALAWRTLTAGLGQGSRR